MKLKEWKDKGKEEFPISLNFSRYTMLHEKLVKQMEEIRRRYGVESKRIEIEVTESAGGLKQERLQETMEEMKGRGYRLSLDDFGVDYSNASLLGEVDFDVLKLDKSIVQGIVVNEKLKIIMKKIIEMCKELKIEIIAEGVETEEQLKRVRKMGCEKIQGYLIDAPLSENTFDYKYRC